jgi:hypothetical protein
MAQSGPRGGISLTPAVVELQGSPGQAHRQTLRLTNHTGLNMAFELVAEDVVIENGVRTFLPAGLRQDSIAATALFSPAEIVVPPGTTGLVEMTVTAVPNTDVRAVAAIFRGRTQVQVRDGVAMSGSLGTLITFSLGGEQQLEASAIEVAPQTATTNLALSQELHNVGREPIVPDAAIALIDAQGRLVTRIAIEPRRLLPGERARLSGDYPGTLPPGSYQAVLSVGYGPHVLTRTVTFDVSPSADMPGAADRQRAGGQ